MIQVNVCVHFTLLILLQSLLLTDQRNAGDLCIPVSFPRRTAVSTRICLQEHFPYRHDSEVRMPLSSYIHSVTERVVTRVQEYAAEQQHSRNNNAMQLQNRLQPSCPIHIPDCTQILPLPTAHNEQGYNFPRQDYGFRNDQGFC